MLNEFIIIGSDLKSFTTIKTLDLSGDSFSALIHVVLGDSVLSGVEKLIIQGT